MKTISTTPAKNTLRHKSHWLMWFCCALMALPLVYYLLFANTTNNGISWDLLLQASPLLLCLGMHWLLHRFSEHSCHSNHPVKTPSKASE